MRTVSLIHLALVAGLAVTLQGQFMALIEQFSIRW